VRSQQNQSETRLCRGPVVEVSGDDVQDEWWGCQGRRKTDRKKRGVGISRVGENRDVQREQNLQTHALVRSQLRTR
jgi:hypothetical protein